MSDGDHQRRKRPRSSLLNRGICLALAEILDTALDSAATEVRIFDHTSVWNGSKYLFPSASAVGGTWIVIADNYVDNLNPSTGNTERVIDIQSHKFLTLNLEDVLVHEADHMSGWSAGQARHTSSPDMAQCGSHGAF